MENITTLQIGERFTYSNYEWVCLDKTEDGIFAMTTSFYDQIPFDVDNHNNWEKSSLRRVLNGDFLDQFDKKVLLPVESDMIADNGDKAYGKCKDYVTILSCDQYRKYRDVVPKFKDDWMWTLTPWSCISGSGYSVRIVFTTGEITTSTASNPSGVAPACMFSSSNLKLCRQAHLVEVEE